MATKDNQVECCKIPLSESKSPWKRLEVVKAEVSPVAGEGDWPSLLEVRRPRNAKVSCILSQVVVEVQKPESCSQREELYQRVKEIKHGGGNGDCPRGEEQCDQQVQEIKQGGSQKEEQCDNKVRESGGGNGDSTHNHEHCHLYLPKQNQNNVLRLPVPVPYSQPAVSRFPSSSVETYGYRPIPTPSHQPIPVPRLPVPVPYSQAAVSMFPSSSADTYGYRPPFFQTSGRPMQGINHSVHNQRPFNPTNHFDTRPGVPGRPCMNMYYQRPFGTQQNSVPRAYYTSQPTPSAAFPGIVPIYYPPPPHGPTQPPLLPRLAPRAATQSLPVMVPQPMTLRESIVTQIEYYFSEKNLISDHYLILQMDGEGWVPITTIANFPRVKKLATNIDFILDALRNSQSVEVKGDKLRKRNNWSKYVFANKTMYDATNSSAYPTQD